MSKKKNRIQKKKKRLAQNKRYTVNNRISSIEAHQHIVSIQQSLSQIEQLLKEEVNNPKSEDSAVNSLTRVAYLHKAIELANKLRQNGYHKMISPKIETQIKSCLELLERITDDNDDEELVEIAPLPKKRETAEILPTKHIYGYSKPDYSAWDSDPSSSLVMA